MKILVTGGAGYIGSTAVHQLIENGDQVVVFDNLSQGHAAAVRDEATFVQGTLADRAAIDAVLAEHQPDGIMHFASNTLVGESMDAPFLYLDDNVRYGLNLLQSAVEHDVERFILSSTANLFGKPESLPIHEDERIDAGSPYGESKFMLERTLHWLDELGKIKYAALRYFNAAGAAHEDLGEDHDPETHLIPIILEVALGQREKIFIFGNDYDTPDGTCVRDYIHVLDLADAHILAMEAIKDGPSRRYNLGNGTGYSVREVIDVAREVTGHPIPADPAPRRPGDPAKLIAGSDAIRDDLGWEPKHSSLEDIIASAWAWHQKHPTGY